MRRVFPSETDQWFNEKGGQRYVKKGEKLKKKTSSGNIKKIRSNIFQG